MDKDQLLFLCKNYRSLTAEESNELSMLVEEYPYSQLIQSLAARAAAQNKLDNSQTRLQMAAVYSTDRAVLKRVVTAPPAARQAAQAAPAADLAVAEKETPAEILVVPNEVDSMPGDDLAERVMEDLEQLKESKHNFELLLDHLEAHPGEEFVLPTPKKKTTRKSSVGEGLIDEIKSTKKKIKPSDPKHKEQIEIINQFIKSQPSIGKSKPNEPTDAESVDLSEKSNALGDHLVSETLVEILLKQGKKEKAIEMLRKLIWKFPQKKAYFAAQIEKLKL